MYALFLLLTLVSKGCIMNYCYTMEICLRLVSFAAAAGTVRRIAGNAQCNVDARETISVDEK